MPKCQQCQLCQLVLRLQAQAESTLCVDSRGRSSDICLNSFPRDSLPTCLQMQFLVWLPSLDLCKGKWTQHSEHLCGWYIMEVVLKMPISGQTKQKPCLSYYYRNMSFLLLLASPWKFNKSVVLRLFSTQLNFIWILSHSSAGLLPLCFYCL